MILGGKKTDTAVTKIKFFVEKPMPYNLTPNVELKVILPLEMKY